MKLIADVRLGTLASWLKTLAVLTLTIPTPALPSPGIEADDGLPYLTNFSPKREVVGLGSQYWAMVQDAQGIMYFGNGAGVVEFDGTSWKLIPTPNNSTVRSLAVDAGGRIYVGAVDEVGFLAPDTRQYVSLMDQLPASDHGFADVWKTHVTPDGVFFQTFTHVLRLTDLDMGTGPMVESWRAEGSFHFSFQVRGVFYVVEREVGLMRFRNGSLEPVPHGESFAQDRIYSMLPFGENEILIATHSRGFFLYDGSAPRPWSTEIDSRLADWQIYHGTALRDGSLAFGTRRAGLLILDPTGRLRLRLDEESGLQSQVIYFVFQDRQGGLWLALEDQIARLEIHSPFSLIDRRSGLRGAVQSIHRHQGTLYVAGTQAVYHLGKESLRVEPIENLEAQSWSLLTVGDALLVSTTEGVYEIQGKKAVRISPDRASRLALSQRHPGRVYVGLFDGLASLRRLEDGSWHYDGRVDGITDDIRSLAEDRQGRVWLGTQHRGVLRLVVDGEPPQAAAVERFESSHGLPPNQGPISVVSTSQGLLFATTEGLYRHEAKGDQFVAFRGLRSGITDGKGWVSVVSEDSQGSLWMFSTTDLRPGVFRRRPDGSFSSWEERFLRRIPSDNMWSIYPEDDGVVWFGHADGLIRFDSARQREPSARFPVLLRRVLAAPGGVILSPGSGTEADGAGETRLRHDENEIRFEFAMPSFDHHEMNRFESFLEGFDRGWSEWSAAPTRTYTNLPPNHYRFRLRARDVHNVVTPEQFFAFTVLPPWYGTWWAYASLTTLALGALVLLARLQTGRAQTRAKVEVENTRRLEELETARRIQKQLLPYTIPRVPYLDIAAFQRTASEVGGDYYDFFPQDEGHLFVAIGDATGHGVAAGLMVTATKTALLTLKSRDLQLAAQRINSVLNRLGLGSRLHMALLLVSLDPEPSSTAVRLEVSGGAMAPFYLLRRNGEAEEVLVPGLPLGALSSPVYPLVSRTLEESDTLILLSDGLPECTNKDGESLGYEALMQEVQAIAQQASENPQRYTADKILKSVVAVGDRWAEGTPQNDDITLVVVKVVRS